MEERFAIYAMVPAACGVDTGIIADMQYVQVVAAVDNVSIVKEQVSMFLQQLITQYPIQLLDKIYGQERVMFLVGITVITTIILRMKRQALYVAFVMEQE